MTLRKRETVPVEPPETGQVEVLHHPLDRFFDDWTGWMKGFPLQRLSLFDRPAAEMIRVDEYQENGVLVVKAELPGIDPDKDVELTVSDHMLHIAAERHEEHDTEEKGYRRHEIRCGSFRRTLPLPTGTSETDVTARYEDGILEVRIPRPETEPTKTIPITKS